jgi:hypothetical protein
MSRLPTSPVRGAEVAGSNHAVLGHCSTLHHLQRGGPAGRRVTRERIRQIEAKALRKLKHPSRSAILRSFLDN